MVLSVRLALGGAFAALKDASQSKRSRGKIGVLYFIQYTITHIFVSLLALTRCQPRLGGGPDEANLQLIRTLARFLFCRQLPWHWACLAREKIRS